jgi:hypothetical protein
MNGGIQLTLTEFGELTVNFSDAGGSGTGHKQKNKR